MRLFLTLFVIVTSARYSECAESDKDRAESEQSPLECYSCASLNASIIVAGAGVDPGVYLSTIPLNRVPITYRCREDDFNGAALLRAGGQRSTCEDGLCVKVNYTDIFTKKSELLRACMPKSRGIFVESCADFRSGQAYGTWCVCGNQLCNSASDYRFTSLLVIVVTAWFTV